MSLLSHGINSIVNYSSATDKIHSALNSIQDGGALKKVASCVYWVAVKIFNIFTWPIRVVLSLGNYSELDICRKELKRVNTPSISDDQIHHEVSSYVTHFPAQQRALKIEIGRAHWWNSAWFSKSWFYIWNESIASVATVSSERIGFKNFLIHRIQVLEVQAKKK